MKTSRYYSKIDQFCLNVDRALKSVFNRAPIAERPYPAQNLPEPNLNETARQHAANLMRINHAGEVCAQALYHGQALLSRNPILQKKMQHAALEENDHLAWCNQRLLELRSHTSYLNPLWYAGSFSLGIAAGFVGDAWSLGFLAETETQVVKHLQHHLALLPKEDTKSQAILKQMQEDEAQHRDAAIQAGAAILPQWIKKLMAFTSKIMVKTAYRV